MATKSEIAQRGRSGLSKEGLKGFVSQLLTISNLSEEHGPKMAALLRSFEARGETLHPEALERLTGEERGQFGREIAAHLREDGRAAYIVDLHELTVEQMELLKTARREDVEGILQTMAASGKKSDVWDGITVND